MSPVSEALQNLVSSAISGTDIVDKDKSSHVSPASGIIHLLMLFNLLGLRIQINLLGLISQINLLGLIIQI